MVMTLLPQTRFGDHHPFLIATLSCLSSRAKPRDLRFSYGLRGPYALSRTPSRPNVSAALAPLLKPEIVSDPAFRGLRGCGENLVFYLRRG
jgi:hypothetical protein